MAVILYRKGTSHTVDGIQCEQGRFEVRRMQHLLSTGWVGDIKELEAGDSITAPTKEEADTNDSGKLSVKEIRAAAEEAGIEDYATARIKTLEAKLWPTPK